MTLLLVMLVQCRQRWQKVLLPGLHKGKWTEEEDILLRYLVSLRLENWGVVAARLPGRTSKQCRERWCHHLAPDVDKSAMTPEENKKLMELHTKWGNRWSKIAAEVFILVNIRCNITSNPFYVITDAWPHGEHGPISHSNS